MILSVFKGKQMVGMQDYSMSSIDKDIYSSTFSTVDNVALPNSTIFTIIGLTHAKVEWGPGYAQMLAEVVQNNIYSL